MAQPYRRLALAAILLLAAIPAAAAHGLPTVDLSVSFDLPGNLVRGTAKIILPPGDETLIRLGACSVKSVTAGGSAETVSKDKIRARGSIEIYFEAVFQNPAPDEQSAGRGMPAESLISPEGIFLLNGWHPCPEGPALYRLKAVVPQEFKAVASADEITVRPTPAGSEYSFRYPHPLDRLTLIAARYQIEEKTWNGIRIAAYFFPEDFSLARTYLDHAEDYLEMYSGLLGPFPFKRFAVVENRFPTGISLPTYTLMGRTVVRLPFITKTSLGHEVLHQWFGSSVSADSRTGNWSEGLTAYLADHLYEDRAGAGWQHRKNLLIKYQSHVHSDKGSSLGSFRQGTDYASRSVGYGKGAMVFHMLKNITGEVAFYAALRKLAAENKFTVVSWSKLLGYFEQSADMDLSWFYRQWVERPGRPALTIRQPRVLVFKGLPTVLFQVAQNGTAYRLDLPVTVITDNDTITKSVPIENSIENIRISVPGKPLELVVDADYDLMRPLSPDELPPVISALFGDPEPLIVLPDNGTDMFAGMAAALTPQGFKTVSAGRITEPQVTGSSLLLAGSDNPLLERLFGGWKQLHAPNADFGAALLVRRHPLNSRKVVAVLTGSSAEEIDRCIRKIAHYGRYSDVGFLQGRNVFKETAEAQRGLRFKLYRPVTGIRPEKALTLDEIIKNIIDTPIIYVGEGHTAYEDHKVQLEVIQSLQRNGRRFAIGMEMFQKPFQQSLDDYIAGSITEESFLKTSEYFKRWKYNYHLYKEIVDFAASNKIPVVALNQQEEVIRQVSRSGISSLSPELQKMVPPDMDFTDADYKKRLKTVFGMHGNSANRCFSNFFQAQILWDETMAHSLDDFLQHNPDYQMVVIAGSGHIEFGSGIPSRAHRLNGRDYVTLLNAQAAPPLKGLADYVLFPEPMDAPQPPRLGVIIDDGPRGVKIVGFSHGSPARKAGLKAGDIITLLDGSPIGTVEDIRIALLSKQSGAGVELHVKRKRFLFSPLKLTCRVTLQ